MQNNFIGVDVSKDWLDLCEPGRGAQQIANGGRALTAFARRAARLEAWVIFEGEPGWKSIQWIDFPVNGGYDRPLCEALERAGARFSRVNPRQARDGACPRAGRRPDPGARAIGVAAKHVPGSIGEPTGSMRASWPIWARGCARPRPSRPRRRAAPSRRRRRADCSWWRCASRRRRG